MWMLVACGFFDLETKVTVVNEGRRAVGPITVQVCESVVFEGMLTAGERRTVRFTPPRDCSFRVIGHGPAGSFEVENMGYTTPNDGQEHVFHLDGSTVRYGDLTLHPNRMRLLLDDPGLRMFLHPEVPGTLPLRVSVPTSLEKEARAATFESQPLELTRSARLVIEEDGDAFRVSVPSEGVVGTASFSKGAAGWSLDALDLAER